MHVFDIIASGLALLFIILGFKRGFAEEIIRLLGIVAAFFTGLALYRQVSTYLTFVKLPGTVLSVISFLLVFLAALLLVILLGMLVRKIIHLTVLGWVDRICGGILGCIKVFFLLWIVVISTSSLPFDAIKHWFKPSKAYTFFCAISPVLKAHGLQPEQGPVQNVLKANPLPAIVNAFKSLEASSKKADSLSKKVLPPKKQNKRE